MKRQPVLVGAGQHERELKARHRLIDAMLQYACERIADPPNVQQLFLDEDEYKELTQLLNANDPIEFVTEHPIIKAFCKKHAMYIDHPPEHPSVKGLDTRLVFRHILFPPISVK